MTACSETTPIAKSCSARADCAEKQFCSNAVCVADADAPSVTISAPATKSLLTLATTSLEGSATDQGSGLALVEFSLDGTRFQPLTLASDKFSQTLELPEVDRTDLTVSVRATDVAGNVGSATVALVVDRLPPTLAITPPEKAQYRASDLGTLVSFSAAATDKSGCTKLEWSLDDGATWTESEDPGALTTSTAVTRDITGLELRFRVRATDSAGLSSSASADPVLVDAVPPALELSSPTDEAVYGLGSAVSIAGTVSDQQLAGVSATLDGSPLALTVEAGTFSAQLPAAQEEQEHTLVVTASDEIGNQTVATLHFAVDDPPVLSIASPAEGTLFSLASPSTATVTGSVTDATPVTLTYRLDSGSPTTVPVAASGSFSVAVHLNDEDFTAHTITFEAADAFGGKATESLSFLVDRRAPVIGLGGPSEGQVFNRAAVAPAKATGTISDAQLASASWKLDSGSPQNLSLSDGSFSLDLPLPDAEDNVGHTLELTATDSAGNTVKVTRHYVVDRVAPRLAVTAPSVSASCAASCSPAEAIANVAKPTLRFAGTSSDGGTVALSLQVAGTTGTPIGTASWTYDWSAPSDNGKQYEAKITATDAAGNSTTDSRVVWVDRVSPTMAMLRANQRLVPRDGDLISFSEPMELASVLAAATFSPSGPTLSASGTKAFRAAALEPYRVYTLDMTAAPRDLAGNPVAAAASQQFLTATAAPPTGVAIHTPAVTPRMAIDADGNPVIAYWDSATSTFLVESWDGKAWTSNAFASAPASTTRTRAVYQIEVTSPAPTGFALERTVRILYGVSGAYGPGVMLTSSKTLALGSWTSFTVVAGTPVDPLSELHGSPSFRTECGSGAPCYTVASFTASTLRTISKWFSGSTLVDTKTDYTIANGKAPYDVRGAGLARPGTGVPELDAMAVYTPTGTEVTSIDASKGGVRVAGAPRAGGASPTGSPWLTFSYLVEYTHPMPPHLVLTRAETKLACNPMTGGSWRVSLGSSPFGSSSSPPATALDLAVGQALVGIAAECADSHTVSFGSASSSCAAAPSLLWQSLTADAREPTVAVGPDSKLWKGYVEDSTGALKLAP